MIERIDKRTKKIFICNPNNLTGTYWDKDRIKRFLKYIDNRQIVVADGAHFKSVKKRIILIPCL